MLIKKNKKNSECAVDVQHSPDCHTLKCTEELEEPLTAGKYEKQL